MVIQIDSREQKPYDFLSCGIDVSTERATLAIGDYTIKDCGHLIAVERKNFDDLICCLGRDRERFAKELLRARQLESFAVVAECSWQDILNGDYNRSQLNPAAAVASIQAFSSRWKVSFFFTGNRENGEAFTCGFLRQWLKGQTARFKAIRGAFEA